MKASGMQTMIGTQSDKQLDAFLAACSEGWADARVLSGPRYVVRVPARLDVMGGIADEAGALVLQSALPVETRVAVAPRNDQNVSITSLGWSNNGHSAATLWPLSLLYTADGRVTSAETFAARLRGVDAGWCADAAGVFYTLLEAGAVPHYAGGASIVLESDIPSEAGLGTSASIATGTGLVLAALTNRKIAPIELARLCQRAENLIAGRPGGITDKVVALLAQRGRLLQMRCQPHELLGYVPLPPNVTVLGIDSQVRSEKRVGKMIDTRVASLMGLRIIEHLLRNDPTGHDLTAGYLANVSPTDYVERFRDALPTKMRGREFLERYGHIDDTLSRVEPEALYKVRSRTEHHIYENDRVHRFAERLSRAARTRDTAAVSEAGELMYASHWSYSQRCGMGSIQTDVLVNQLRNQGAARGIYGAKVTSGGCGGTVAALLADTALAHEAVEAACRAYAEKTSLQPRIFTDFGSGAALEGPQPIH
jgi:galactokinase